MSCVLYSSYEVGLLSLIGCGFEFGVNGFEKEYLRKCAFWQRLQTGMYGAHVSQERDVRSLGSPLENVPLPNHHPHLQLHGSPYRGRPQQPDAKQNIHVTLPCMCVWICVWSFSLSTHRHTHCTHACTHRQTQHSHSLRYICTYTDVGSRTPLLNVWNEGKKGTSLVILNIKNNCIQWTFELYCVICLK